MSQSGSDDFLIQLFREEVRTNCQVLAEGLAVIEQDPADPKRLEAMMRAAHSIKGAARVVNVQPGVELAHAMEDCFVRAQKAELTLTAAAVDVLLSCVDLLQAVAQAAGEGFIAWLEGRRADVAQHLECLRRVVNQEPADVSDASLSPHAPQLPGNTADASPRAKAVHESPAGDTIGPIAPGAREPAAANPVEASTNSSRAAATPTEDGVVRVTARNLTRLMGLAGESLVEARWLQPFSKSLLQLKSLHGHLADTLEDLDESVRSKEPHEQCASLVADAQARLAACRELLIERMGEFDRRMHHADDLSARLYREVISSRMRPFRDGVHGLPRLVRDLARELGKRVQLEILGEATEVDRDILDRLDAPLNHLVRNAVDHGFETPEQREATGKPPTGRLRIEAIHRAGLLAITVADDGRGVDLETIRAKVIQRGHAAAEVAQKFSEAELLEFLFLPGFSTATAVSEISGRGVGLDVVHAMVHSVGGQVRVRTEPGRGTTFQIELPVTLSVLRAVVVDIAGEPYAFPHNRIDRVIRVPYSELCSLENRQYFQVDGQNVGIVLARQVFQWSDAEPAGEDMWIVLLGERSERYGLVVDALLGEQDLVVRPLDRRLGKVPNLHAAGLLDDGSPVLIVDPDDLRRSIEKLLEGSRLQRAGAQAASQENRRQKRILVVDDSITVREVERQLLANQGYVVEVAVDGMEGWNQVHQERFDLVVSDIDMPRMDGIELVRKIKADTRLHALPVIIVSYKDRKEDRLQGLEAGANYYLAKSSFHDDTLIQAVRELIGEAESV